MDLAFEEVKVPCGLRRRDHREVLLLSTLEEGWRHSKRHRQNDDLPVQVTLCERGCLAYTKRHIVARELDLTLAQLQQMSLLADEVSQLLVR